jgi:hypothetical protein
MGNSLLQSGGLWTFHQFIVKVDRCLEQCLATPNAGAYHMSASAKPGSGHKLPAHGRKRPPQSTPNIALRLHALARPHHSVTVPSAVRQIGLRQR